GVTHHGGRGPARQRGQDHGCHSILRIRTPGSEGSTARPDYSQTRGEFAVRLRCKPRPYHGPACPTGAGVLRYSGGSPLFSTRVDQISATTAHRENDSCFSGFRRTQDGFGLRGSVACESRDRGEGTPKRHGDRGAISHW